MLKYFPARRGFPLLAAGWLILWGGCALPAALPETAPAFATQTILLAEQLDGQPLLAKNGPYQLVVPLEKRPTTRWVRQLTDLRIVNVR